MSRPQDYLYGLLPIVHRMRDAEQGYPLRALLRVIGEQEDAIEENIAQLYANWFIETAEDWAVPYLGDLVGYRPVHDAGEPAGSGGLADTARNRVLIPRREVAKTVHYRRRKGTLALLEDLANDVAGWPARAIEFYTLLGWTQSMNHGRPGRGQMLSLRDGRLLDRLGTAFDGAAHTIDVRRTLSHHALGRHNVPSIGLFTARLRSYSVTDAPACCVETEGSQCFTFSVLGNDSPLFTARQTRPIFPTVSTGEDFPETAELLLPLPISRRAFEQRGASRPHAGTASPLFYGPGRSVAVTARGWKGLPVTPVQAADVVPTDLSDWHAYRAPRNKVLMDPVLGRLVFPAGQLPKGVQVSYHYGFSTNLGGGEYHRTLSAPAEATVYRVRKESRDPAESALIMQAYEKWMAVRGTPDPTNGLLRRAAVIEIQDSRAYEERFEFALAPGESLQVRAADGARPVLRLLDYRVDQPDPFSITGGNASRFTLDGLLVVGRGIEVNGQQARRSDGSPADPTAGGDLCDVTIRHCTLVPGWNLDCDCEPQRPQEASLTLDGTLASVRIVKSILGSIWVLADERLSDPPRLELVDSILDATASDGLALSDPTGRTAFTTLTVRRCTVVGAALVHSVELAENSLFLGPLRAARRQLGCVRFSYLAPGSRAPGGYHCQPEMARRSVEERLRSAEPGAAVDPASVVAARERETLRVGPIFTSLRYATPGYGQLAADCAVEITRGADDESEMGVFHDLYQPQRAANLRARLDEYTVAGYEAGIFFTS
jgi:hypothetical protein